MCICMCLCVCVFELIINQALNLTNFLIQIPRDWVPEDSCGTDGPGWMKGELPAIKDGIVQRTVCFHLDKNKCYVSTKILVRKCPGFYSYKLNPINYYGRYCTVDHNPDTGKIVFNYASRLNALSYCHSVEI